MNKVTVKQAMDVIKQAMLDDNPSKKQDKVMSDYIEYKVRVYGNGTKEWRLDGKRHREDGPAVEEANGTKFWHLNGERHREDGPAVEGADGYKAWYLNGKRHREDGPAVEWAYGEKSWYLNDELHREDGPAIEYVDGTKFWYLNGKYYTESEYKAEMAKRDNTCEGKIVTIEGKKYLLTSILTEIK